MRVRTTTLGSQSSFVSFVLLLLFRLAWYSYTENETWSKVTHARSSVRLDPSTASLGEPGIRVCASHWEKHRAKYGAADTCQLHA